MSGPGDSVHPQTRTVRDGGYMKTIAEPGITKRELFAAMAMQGLASVPAEGGLKPSYIAADAANAVAYADALLAELAKDGAP